MSTKENREKEAKKLKYKKMGFSKMMDSGEIDFGDGKKSSKKSFEHPMAEERFQQTARARLKKSGLEDSEIGDPRTKTEIKDNAKKMGGGMMQRPMGYTKGGSQQGYGAARTSGMGLQDEELKPGKVYKAKRGSGLDLPVINSVKPTVNKTKRAQNLSEMKIQFTKQKNRTGINSGTLDKILSKTKNPYSDLKATTAKGPTQYSSMDEMRQAKGFKPGESNTAFLKRRMDLRAATKAVSATKIGKIALGVGAAGVAASQYLKSKMNKKEVKKKMGGGMMKKYSKGGGADMGSSRYKAFKTTQDVLKTLKDSTDLTSTQKQMLTYAKAKTFKNQDRLTERDIKKASSLVKGKMGGGMMMQRPMGYKSGTFVQARGCKLGRTRPTKIT